MSALRRLGVTLAALACGGDVAAQDVTTLSTAEKLGFDRPESWAMKRFTSITLLTGMGGPMADRAGTLRVGLEGDWIPHLSVSERTVGFNGTKVENLNQLPVLARVRVTVALPWRLSLGVGWIPPLRINGVRASLIAFAVGRPIVVEHGLRIGLRVYGQLGHARADATCSPDEVRAGDDRTLNPFGCLERSRDKVTLRYYGVELDGAYRIRPAHGLTPYIGLAVNYLDLATRIGARYDDVIDRTHQSTRGVTFSLAGGLRLPLWRRFDVVGEAFYSPLGLRRPGRSHEDKTLFNARALLELRFGGRSSG